MTQKVSSAAIVCILSSFMLGASQCARPVKPDLALTAVQSGDYTALIEGCGNQLVPGYTYCRVSEGDVSNSSLTFVAPPAECLGKDPCVTFKVFFPNGEPTLGGSIPRGKTRVTIPWKELVKRDTFQLSDRGFWPYSYRIRWIDPQGKEQITQSEGEIRLRVVSKDYISLADIPEDENFVWIWMDDKIIVKMTTGARTYVGKK